MKNYYRLGLLVLVVLMGTSCSNKKEEVNFDGDVSFSFEIKQENNGRTSSTPSKAIVSIKNSNGDDVYTLEETELVPFNSTFISSPITLGVGDYTLTEFIIAESSGNSLYATPKEGSATASLVSDALPISFTISSDQSEKITPQVISTVSLTPSDFGYTNFSFDGVDTFDILLGVFTLNTGNENHELTTASAIIKGDGITIFSSSLSAETNQLTLKGGHTEYYIEVTKTGYVTHTSLHSAANMEGYFTAPLIILLTAE